MKKPDIPDNESERLKEVHRLDILDTSTESSFDDLTRLASMICGTTFSTVSIIDEERQWFKSVQGPLGAQETTRDISFCGHALNSPELLIVEDTHTDERFADNPLVTGGPRVRFYAGAPLVMKSGLIMGTLCVFDPKPKALSEDQQEGLRLLSYQVTERLERRIFDSITASISSVLELGDINLILFDPVQERVDYVNPALQSLMGENMETSSRRLFSQLFPDVAYDRFFSSERLNDPELGLRKITRLSLPQDANRRAELRLLGAGKNTSRDWVLAFRDTTDITQTRDSVQEAQTNFKVFYQLATQSRTAFVVTDTEGKVQWVNSSFEQMTGYKLVEMVGKKPGDVLQGEQTSELDKDRISRHIKANKTVVQEILNYTKSGKPYWNEVYIEPIVSDSGAVTNFIAAQTDVTRRKQENQGLKRSRAEAEQANRAKSQFLAKISHELRTPLNGIVGITEKLLKEAPQELSGSVTTLDQSSQHLMTILDDLLDLSHIESGQLELKDAPFNLPSLLRDVEQLFSPRAALVGTEIRLDFSPSLPQWLSGDEVRLKQILMNLVSNAVKFTREGAIVITARLADAQPASDSDRSIYISVTDNGPGIADADQARIFESFEQLDNSSTRTYGGSGLGLAICKQLVEAMDGEIALSSQLGDGATFSLEITLPVITPPAAEELTEQRMTTARSRRLEHALVIDDNEVNCRVLEDLLKRLGCPNVYTGHSARRGLAILENIQPDLVFIDLQMPGMNGFELIEHLQRLFGQQGRQMPLAVAFTAEVSDAKRRECKMAGFDAHLAKPVTGKSLRKLLGQLSLQVGDHELYFTGAPTTPPPSKVAAKSDEPFINREALIDSFLDNEDLLEDFLSLLVENLPEHVTRVREALKTGTITAHADAAHSIKGLVGYFNGETLQQQASALESTMKNGEIRLARETFTELDASIIRLDKEARALLAKLRKP